ncbi:MAG: hypothetical protein U1F67_20955 [Rubrivivax sp.]
MAGERRPPLPAHPFTDHQALAKKGARVITRADNIYLEDRRGPRILDAMSGLWCVNVGYASARSSTQRGSPRCPSTAFFEPRRRRSSWPSCWPT